MKCKNVTDNGEVTFDPISKVYKVWNNVYSECIFESKHKPEALNAYKDYLNLLGPHRSYQKR